MLQPSHRLALYMEANLTGPFGKMGSGVLRYSPNEVVAVIDSEHAGSNARDLTGVPRDVPVVAKVHDARALGADVLVLGIAPPGGLIPEAWRGDLDEAVALGFSLVNGLHDLLSPRYPHLPSGQFVWDLRVEPEGLAPSQGLAQHLPGRRLLMIGTDMAIGKMTAGLEIYRVAREHGIHAAFVATGQIGITIMGSGVPLDAIRVDFAGGAIEREVMRTPDAELIVIEGQGALCHPSSSANLPLLRGGAPTHLILCHRAGMTRLRRDEFIAVPPLGPYCRLYEDLAEACGTFPRPQTCGVALNTVHLSLEDAEVACQAVEQELGVPCVDPIRHGADRLVQAVMA